MRYHGGKFGNMGTMADKIIASFPPHRVYVEPFGGAASVLMRKPRSYAEVYNDLAAHVVSVFRVLRDPEKGRRLQELIELTPFARDEFKATMGALPTDEIEMARIVIFRSCAGFGSASANLDYDTGFRSNSNRSHTTPAMDWHNYPPHIRKFIDRLRGVVIENKPGVDVMLQHDSIETLHFVDPPYVHSTRSVKAAAAREYTFEMTDTQHEELAACLHGLKGMVVLSGYRSKLYDTLYGDWESADFKAVADGAKPRTETLWFNPAATSARRLPLERVIA